MGIRVGLRRAFGQRRLRVARRVRKGKATMGARPPFTGSSVFLREYGNPGRMAE